MGQFLSNRRLVHATMLPGDGWQLEGVSDPARPPRLNDEAFRFLFQDMAEVADLSGEVVFLLGEAGKAAKKEGVPVHIRHLLLAAGSLLPAAPQQSAPKPMNYAPTVEWHHAAPQAP